MYRSTLVRRSRQCGLFQRTGIRRFFWNKKTEELHRQARQRPWWETAAIIGGLLIFINVSSVVYYFGNRWYQTWRPSGNDIYVLSTIDSKLFSRPDLAVAAVRMTMHHALSNTQTPFGCPIVASESLRPEAEELLDLVWNLHMEQPAYSIPDLWAIVTSKALARLGGPNLQASRGRNNPPDFLAKNQLLAFPKSLVLEDTRDVLSMKRVLSRQGLSLEELVAVIACDRNIGFHESTNFHTTEEVKPRIRQRPSTFGPSEDQFHLPDLVEKCTLDPYVFGGEYFSLLLDYNWRQPGRFKKSPLYRCDEKDRRREVLLLDPFSEKSLDAEKRRIEAAERARSIVETANTRSDSVLKGEDAIETSRYGRSGEAQFLPGVKVIQPEEDESKKVSEEEFVETDATPIEVCGSVSMRGVDMMLLDDALTRGWLHRFSENELEFYATVGEVMNNIQNRGYNSNKLYMSR